MVSTWTVACRYHFYSLHFTSSSFALTPLHLALLALPHRRSRHHGANERESQTHNDEETVKQAQYGCQDRIQAYEVSNHKVPACRGSHEPTNMHIGSRRVVKRKLSL